MLCFCHTTPTQTEALCFACFSSGWATIAGRLPGPQMGNSIKCLSQWHSDALPHRVSNQGFATFRLLARRSTNLSKNFCTVVATRFPAVKDFLQTLHFSEVFVVFHKTYSICWKSHDTRYGISKFVAFLQMTFNVDCQ